MLPTRMNDVTPTRASSSTAIAVEGQPIPVEVTVIGWPRYVPTIVRCSRLWATSRGVVEVLGDERHPEWVAGHQRDRADLARRDADVELAAVATDAALVDGAQASPPRHETGCGGAADLSSAGRVVPAAATSGSGTRGTRARSRRSRSPPPTWACRRSTSIATDAPVVPSSRTPPRHAS